MDEGLATVKMNTAERQAAIRQQLSRVDVSAKDQDTAFLIELVGGIFGLLGVGYIYSGLTNAGLVRLVGLIGFWIIFSIIGTVTFGFGFCLAPLVWLAQIYIAYVSANELKQAITNAKAGQPAMGAGGYIGGNYETPAPPYNVGDRDREL
jgi:hypothetical protein